MAALGPFEPGPVIAVGVSGGADSLALALLVKGWAAKRGGRVVALTVDHGLRVGSAREAREVARWLKRRDLEHHVLRWQGAKPRTGIPAAARAARYRLLTDWCRRAGVLHLALGHHLEDQAETFLLRLARGSGVDGLAAMAPVTELGGVRLLRPLLDVEKERLRASLRRRGQEWIEDPSNADPGFARTRMRAQLPELAAEGLTPGRLATTAARMARARNALEAEVARNLAYAVDLHPAGYARIDPRLFRSLPDELSLRALSRLLMCIGGLAYPPRLERLERLHRVLSGPGLDKARTLGGCRMAPDRDRLLLTREAAGASEAIEVRPGDRYFWDGRFEVRLGPGAPGRGLVLRRLGPGGWRALVEGDPRHGETGLPPAARSALPALWDLEGLLAVPQLDFKRAGAMKGRSGLMTARFRPRQPLAGGIVYL
ncbi:MAG: tRNA lysidine(34) synthetase TilS [Alphaproteobacteria bacterium]